MSQGIINVTLNRDGPSTPWGFRLHGGTDIGYPLTIQKVFLGSPSERELHRGDILLGINEHDASGMTHMDAHDVIKSTGNQLQLVVHRLPSTSFTPVSPATSSNVQPIANAVQIAAKQPSFIQPAAQKFNQPNRVTAPQSWTPPPTRTYQASGFQPNHPPKTRFQDTGINRPKTQPYFMQKLPSANFSPTPSIASPSLPPSFAESGPQLVNIQYNSPLGLYSKEAVAESIKAQSSIQPKCKPKSPLPAIESKAIPATNQDNPISPTATTPGALSPARPGTKLTNIVDITLSPTFQMIQEAENRSSSPRPELQTPPPLVRAQPTTLSRLPGGYPLSSNYQDPMTNAFGSSRETIHQSGSFKTLMATLAYGNQDL